LALKGGGSASLRANGQIRSVNRNGMHIEHNLHGGRTIVREHNGARIVSTGRHGGYVQRMQAAAKALGGTLEVTTTSTRWNSLRSE